MYGAINGFVVQLSTWSKLYFSLTSASSSSIIDVAGNHLILRFDGNQNIFQLPLGLASESLERHYET